MALPLRRAAVVARDSKEDAVKALENYASGARANLKEPLATSVPVTPLVSTIISVSPSCYPSTGILVGQGRLSWPMSTLAHSL